MASPKNAEMTPKYLQLYLLSVISCHFHHFRPPSFPRKKTRVPLVPRTQPGPRPPWVQNEMRPTGHLAAAQNHLMAMREDFAAAQAPDSRQKGSFPVASSTICWGFSHKKTIHCGGQPWKPPKSSSSLIEIKPSDLWEHIPCYPFKGIFLDWDIFPEINHPAIGLGRHIQIRSCWLDIRFNL